MYVQKRYFPLWWWVQDQTLGERNFFNGDWGNKITNCVIMQLQLSILINSSCEFLSS